MSAGFAATAAITLIAMLTRSGCTYALTESGLGPDLSTTDSVPLADADNADVIFAVMMIPHYEQAVEMADM